MQFFVAAATVAALIATVRSGLQEGRPDPVISRSVRELTLDERLDDAVIEQLESEGAGPSVLEELDRHRELSRGRSVPASPPHLFDAPAAPSNEAQTRIIDKVREAALRYNANLPNFICRQTVRRFADAKGTQNWKPTDTLTISLTYSGKEEQYTLTAVNGKPTRKQYDKLGGFNSNGEFGSKLRVVFEPKSQTHFEWERWSNLHGRRAMVFAFAIERAHSHYTVNWSMLFKRYSMTAGMVGRVWIDAETLQILRVADDADRYPSDWPILRTPGVLDYEYVEIADRRYLLPKRVDSRVVLRNQQRRNVTEFSDFRKFAGESSITFDK